MAIVFDAVSTKAVSSSAPTSPWNWNHTITSSGVGRIVLIGIAHAGLGVNPSSAPTYGGSATTLLGRAQADNLGTGIRVHFYYLVDPATGTKTASITWPSNQYGAAAAISYTGIDVNNPIGTPVTGSGQDVTSLSVNVSSGSGELVVDTIGVRNKDAPGTISAGAGQTTRYDVDDGTNARQVAGSEEDGAGTTTMSWSWSGTDHSAMVAVPLKPAVDTRGRLVHYYSSTKDPNRRILDTEGRNVRPELVGIDKWIRSDGPFFPTPRRYATLVEDPAIHYLEAIALSSLETLSIESLSETQLESLIRRLGGRGL